MKKLLLYVGLPFSLALCLSIPARAQFGGGTDCGDSPENPTLVLAGLASGAFAVSSIRAHIRARRNTKNR